MKNPISSAQTALDALHHELDGLRQRVADLKDERAGVEAMPATRAEAGKAIQAQVAAMGRDYAGRRAHVVARIGVEPAHLTDLLADPNDLLGLLALTAPDSLSNALVALVPEDGISGKARADQLADLDARLLEAETSEERLIAGAERAGFSILRRADADPAAVLSVEP